LSSTYAVLRRLCGDVAALLVSVARGVEQLETVRFESLNPTFLLHVGKPTASPVASASPVAWAPGGTHDPVHPDRLPVRQPLGHRGGGGRPVGGVGGAGAGAVGGAGAVVPQPRPGPPAVAPGAAGGGLRGAVAGAGRARRVVAGAGRRGAGLGRAAL